MSYVEKMLLPDERVVYMALLHWVIFIPGMMLTGIGGILGYYSYDIVSLLVSGPDGANHWEGLLLLLPWCLP